VVNDASGKPILEGSGFLVSADGKIVTNHHVIASAVSATAKLNNGAFFQVEGIIADDPEHDLALIKVPGKNLPYLSLESAENISVGQHVLAIGSPLGLENSVSDGIVSGFRDGEHGKSWIQTHRSNPTALPPQCHRQRHR
jgi:S1-C subfamily serine protease